ASATYTILQQVATPTFGPDGGTYVGSQSVTLIDATSGATIHYTTDGTTPTAASPIYSAPISVAVTTMIKAMATASGMANSAMANEKYTIRQPILTVNKTGSGTVISSPAGIACGSNCSASYASGTQVVLTAVAATGSIFAGWSG